MRVTTTKPTARRGHPATQTYRLAVVASSGGAVLPDDIESVCAILYGTDETRVSLEFTLDDDGWSLDALIARLTELRARQAAKEA